MEDTPDVIQTSSIKLEEVQPTPTVVAVVGDRLSPGVQPNSSNNCVDVEDTPDAIQTSSIKLEEVQPTVVAVGDDRPPAVPAMSCDSCADMEDTVDAETTIIMTRLKMQPTTLLAMPDARPPAVPTISRNSCPDMENTVDAVKTTSMKLSGVQPTTTLLAVPDARVLCSTVAEQRAVAHNYLLTGRGQLWEPSEDSAYAYSKSESVATFDEFISHDWGTPRWPKFFTLCLHYNCTAALVGGFMFLLFGCVLSSSACNFRAFKVFYFTAVCPGIVFIFMVQWHRVRGMWWRPRTVFVDKACINQHDADLKAAGILGLGGFIKNSRSLVILWSPRTFSRLWCVYEYASWVRYKKGADNVYIRPVAHGWLVFVGFLVVWLFAIFGSVLLVHFQVYSMSLGIWILTGVVIIAMTRVPLRTVLQQKQQAMDLRVQLQCFSIHHASCFCCSVGHIHPETREPIPCDRKLIEYTIEQWLGGTHTGDMAAGAYFDVMVQQCLSQNALRMFNVLGHRLPYHIMAVIMFPYLCFAVAYASDTCCEDQWDFVFKSLLGILVVHNIALTWCVVLNWSAKEVKRRTCRAILVQYLIGVPIFLGSSWHLFLGLMAHESCFDDLRRCTCAVVPEVISPFFFALCFSCHGHQVKGPQDTE